MIVKETLSPRRVVQYTARPMAWAAGWALAAPVAYEVTGESALALPFAPVGALGAALAIFIAFRNNASFARWNEARTAWQAFARLVAERLATTPTPRQYAYFTRRFVLLFAALAPFGLLSVVPDAIWWAAPLALALSGVLILMEVTGTANDEPFAGAVTDVPIATIAAQVERDVREQLGDEDLPAVPVPVDGYLW